MSTKVQSGNMYLGDKQQNQIKIPGVSDSKIHGECRKLILEFKTIISQEEKLCAMKKTLIYVEY